MSWTLTVASMCTQSGGSSIGDVGSGNDTQCTTDAPPEELGDGLDLRIIERVLGLQSQL